MACGLLYLPRMLDMSVPGILKNLKKMKLNNSLNTSVTLSLAVLATPLLIENVNADVVTVNASSSGWYNKYGLTNPLNPALGYGDAYRDWLGFDLSSIDGVITGATLKVNSDPRNGSGQAINWFDVTTPYANLGVVNGGLAGKAIFSDLGTGILFGQGTHTAGTLNSYVLNADALASLNASESMWAIGGQSSAPSSAGFAFGYRNGVSAGETIQLVLDVEPIVHNERIPSTDVPDAGSTLGMISLGICGLFAFSRRNAAAKA